MKPCAAQILPLASSPPEASKPRSADEAIVSPEAKAASAGRPPPPQNFHLPKWLMCTPHQNLHTEAMNTAIPDLSSFSQALVDLVAHAAGGLVAVKAAPYRVVSGISLRDNLVAVTNHTLRREDRIPVRAANGSEAQATILGRDPGLDLAILKADGLNLKSFPTSDPLSLKPGMLAAVVGLTIDVGPTASLGILGAVGPSRHTWRGGTLDHFVRLDVNLYPSQSGAAVVDAAGHLIGLATPALLRHSGLAVPVATLNRVADELLKEGRIRQGYLGVGLQPVAIPAHLREKLATASESGLIVLSVEPDAPAHRAGVQLGDIFLSLDDKPITDIDELQIALRGDAVGRTLKAVLIRGGEAVEALITVSERARKER